MIKRDDPRHIIGLIFDIMRRMRIYKKYPRFQKLGKQEYISIILLRGVDSAYGVYKKGKRVGGGIIYKNGGMHFAVKPKYGKHCGFEPLRIRAIALKKFGEVTTSVEVENCNYIEKLLRVGWIKTDQTNDENGNVINFTFRG